MHVCTHLNAFLMVIPNMVMKFYNFEIVHNFCKILHVSYALASRIVSVKDGRFCLYLYAQHLRNPVGRRLGLIRSLAKQIVAINLTHDAVRAAAGRRERL